MEIRQLHSFIKIVELQSFSKAAEALGYTQAAFRFANWSWNSTPAFLTGWEGTWN